MSRSLNEIQRLCQKAVEGAGAPPDLDVEAAWGAAWLLARDLPALASLAADLERCAELATACRFARDALDGDTLDAGGKAGAVIAPLLTDLAVARAAQTGGPGRLQVEGLTAPLFLLPAAVGHGRQGRSFHLALTAGAARHFAFRVAPGGQADILGDGDLAGLSDPEVTWSLEAVCGEATEQVDLPVLRSGAQLDAAVARSLAAGVTPDPEAWARLQVYAAKVLVPATEQSHRLGAGALTSDNE